MGAVKLENLPHYTYDDYVIWEGKWELIDGIAYAMSPAPTFEHQSISQKIAGELYNVLKDCEFCQAQLPIDWQISDDTVVQPDNMVICSKIKSTTKLLESPKVVFEILSPSTSRKDRTIKYKLYEEAGVLYYVLVNPVNKACEIYVLEDNKFVLAKEIILEKFDFELQDCNFTLDFAKLF